jgi:hypothetical protein
MENKNIKEKKLKIAIYLVGQWRGSSFKCYEYLKEIWKDYDFHTFVHTWDFYDGKSFPFVYEEVELKDVETQTYSNHEIEKIKNTIENLVYFETESKAKNKQMCELIGNNAFSQWYCAYKCNEYRKYYENMNGIRYDIILKLRPDGIVDEDSIKSFHKCFKSVSNDYKNIYSKYYNTFDDITLDNPKNLVWDYFTISSPFGSDGLLEWVKDIMNGNEVYSTDYILNSGLIPNQCILDEKNFEPPNMFIVRELFKYFDLKYFFEKKYYHRDNSFNPNLVYSLNRILYSIGNYDDDEYELFNSLYDIQTWLTNNIDFSNKSNRNPGLTNLELKKLSEYLISKQDEYETKLNNL